MTDDPKCLRITAQVATLVASLPCLEHQDSKYGALHRHAQQREADRLQRRIKKLEKTES